MNLIDCFIELIAYVSYLIKSLPGEQPGYERVKADISELIANSQSHCKSHQISSGDFELAQFAVFAWIDEVILSSQWQEKLKWQGDQLQRSYFQTVDAGELFFDKLNELEPLQLGVREVYYICLALGFSGRFCNPGDEFLLNQLKSSNLKLLNGDLATVDALKDKRLFPEAYSDGSGSGVTVKRRFFRLGTVLAAGAPVILLVLLFVIYQFSLSSVGENLIKSIH
jgi:type VI secretion system protein ImpK